MCSEAYCTRFDAETRSEVGKDTDVEKAMLLEGALIGFLLTCAPQTLGLQVHK